MAVAELTPEQREAFWLSELGDDEPKPSDGGNGEDHEPPPRSVGEIVTELDPVRRSAEWDAIRDEKRTGKPARHGPKPKP